MEYRLAGINQVQIKPEIDLDFASCVRSIMRQDPDIVLIGEIRDRETAEIAIQTSITGHLVMGTFHTNDAASVTTRLMFMGIEPYMLASSLNLVVAQRLVRKICVNCREATPVDDQTLKQLRLDEEKARQCNFYHGRGCPDCANSGYSGRMPLFEFMVVDTKIRDAIISGASEPEIRTLARRSGLGSLLDSGVKKVVQGLTTPEEVISATYAEDINI